MTPVPTGDKRRAVSYRQPQASARERAEVDAIWLRTKPAILKINEPPFDLRCTLMCGQTFRWRENDPGRFLGVVSGRVLSLQQKGDRLLYRSLPESFPSSVLRRYLGLDPLHAEALRSFPQDPILLRAVREFRGIRLLRQDPWETLISFIISSNNNIKRITNSIESLCRTFGSQIHPQTGFYSFPSPDSLANAPLTTLREKCNLGYRDAYVKQAAKRVARNPRLLAQIACLPYLQARKEIMQLPGVGPKVADCVLLYSMGKLEAFPVDTWTRRIIQQHYLPRERPTRSRITAFARRHFGPFAGCAQLFLFHYARSGGTSREETAQPPKDPRTPSYMVARSPSVPLPFPPVAGLSRGRPAPAAATMPGVDDTTAKVEVRCDVVSPPKMKATTARVPGAPPNKATPRVKSTLTAAANGRKIRCRSQRVRSRNTCPRSRSTRT